ncbi:MAG: aldo/keto reductase, partial [Anaerovorax sp.]
FDNLLRKGAEKSREQVCDWVRTLLNESLVPVAIVGIPSCEEIINAHPWDFCQIQLNYMDAEFQAGVKGLEYAASKGLSVIIMEPLKGGKLTDSLPPSVEKYWETTPVKRSPADWALRWVADFPQVMTILSGMSTMEQLEENIKILSSVQPNSLTQTEQGIIKKVSDEYNRLIQYSCTGCKYCMPCPLKIDIPLIIKLYNEWFLYEGNEKTKADYDLWVHPKRTASTCIACKACEAHCPQSLPVSEIMTKAAAIFD